MQVHHYQIYIKNLCDHPVDVSYQRESHENQKHVVHLQQQGDPRNRLETDYNKRIFQFTDHVTQKTMQYVLWNGRFAIDAKGLRAELEPEHYFTDWSHHSRGAKIAQFAQSRIGKGYYKYGGENPDGAIDCSAFSRYVIKNVTGVTIKRTADEQMKQEIGERIDSVKNLKPGDLVFFHTYKEWGKAGHVGIYVGDGKMVHSGGKNGKPVNETLIKYYTFIGGRRI